MARTIAQIQSQIMAQIAADPTLGTQLTSPSQVAIYKVFAYIVATALSIEEQLRDIFQTEIETDLAAAPPGTPQWIVKMLLYFQYSGSTTNPQYVSVNLNASPIISYPTVNTAYNVITNAAVITNPNKTVLIKVAPASTSLVFDTGTINALQSYLDQINFAGVSYQIINSLPDLFLIGGNIYYDGQYTNTIQAAVNTAINNYLASLPFNGLITLNGSSSNPGLIDAIMAVAGVQDVEFTYVSIRLNNAISPVPVNGATLLVNNQQYIYRNSSTYSGRAIIDSANQGTGNYSLNFIVNNTING